MTAREIAERIVGEYQSSRLSMWGGINSLTDDIEKAIASILAERDIYRAGAEERLHLLGVAHTTIKRLEQELADCR